MRVGRAAVGVSMNACAFAAAAAAITMPIAANATVSCTFVTNEPFAGEPLAFTLEADTFVGEDWIQRDALKNASATLTASRS
jgi:hypothetical protein